MKAQKSGDRPRKQARRRLRLSNRGRDQDHVTEMLKLCLQKICELQTEMELEEDNNTHDPEGEGYTACGIEALRFLSAQGLPPDHPMVRALTEKLTRYRD